ncbi:MAG: cadherin-like beta sandwich domain-containing protein [Firmicutes bacterium]|nr:cadherin-like beta sandwich domain-containing protein [Bacillota bacterium]
MKKTLLVVMLALTMIFAFTSMAMAAESITLVDTTVTAADATVTIRFSGFTAGNKYAIGEKNATPTEITIAEDGTYEFEYKPAAGWTAGANTLNVEYAQVQENATGQKTAITGTVTYNVPSNKAELEVKVATGQTGYTNVEKSADGKTFTVYSTLAAPKVTLTASEKATIDKTSPLTVSANTTVKVTAEDGTEVVYTIKFEKVSVTIDGPYTKSSVASSSKLDVETDGGKKYIARGNGKGSLYFEVKGLETGMTVSGADKVSGKDDVYEAEYAADATSLTIAVKKGTNTIISETYNLVRPTLDSILVYDDDNESKADEVTKFSSSFAATYTFDEDWEDLYILPIPNNSKYVESIEVDGDELDLDDDEWFEMELKKDAYEIEIDVTVEVGDDKASQTYTLFVSNDEYEGGGIEEFIANDDDDTKTPYLTFVGKDKIYVFVPYDNEGDDIYFQALTGKEEDKIFYGSSDEAVDGDDDDEWYKAEELDAITVEDEYGFTTTYEVVIVTADDDDLEDDTFLSELELTTGKKSNSIKNEVEISPAFNKNTKAYTAAVEDEDQKFGKISLKLSDKNAYVFINGEFVGTGTSKTQTATIQIDPKAANKFDIVVVAEDCESDDTYTLTINGSNSTALKSLTVTGLSKTMSPSFNAQQMNYIGYTSAASVTLSAVAESSACTVTIAGPGSKSGLGTASGSFSLAQGLNVFTITGYQKGLTSSTYTVSLYRVPDTKTIKVSKQNVTVNGTAKTLTAYNINGNNFLQLRDVALLLSGTAKGFGVSFDGNTQSAYLTTGSTYTANGTENAAISNYTRAALSTQKFYLNNTAINPAAFNIDGSNYVMLRDLGVLLNFGITYSNNTIAINTNTNYVPGK